MKELSKKLFKNIFLDTFLYVLLIIILSLVLNGFGYEFLNWVKGLSIFLMVIGIIGGTIQLVNDNIEKKSKKIILNVIIVLTELIIIVFGGFIFLLFEDCITSEEIEYRDDQKMIKATHDSFGSHWICYYEYENIFVRKKQKKIEETHDDYIGDYQMTYYYDENGQLIKTDQEDAKKYNKYIKENNMALDVDNSEINENNLEILYEIELKNNTLIRVVVKDYVLAQRRLIGIQKSTDGGITWNEQLDTSDKVIQINNEAKFIFFDENIGFINDLGLTGTIGDNRKLLVTVDGGKNFKEVVIEPEDLKENLYVQDVPYMEDNILKIKAHKYENSEIKDIELYSKDNGVTWKENN